MLEAVRTAADKLGTTYRQSQGILLWTLFYWHFITIKFHSYLHSFFFFFSLHTLSRRRQLDARHAGVQVQSRASRLWTLVLSLL